MGSDSGTSRISPLPAGPPARGRPRTRVSKRVIPLVMPQAEPEAEDNGAPLVPTQEIPPAQVSTHGDNEQPSVASTVVSDILSRPTVVEDGQAPPFTGTHVSLRHQDPVPAVPWPLRLRTWFGRRTRQGSAEAWNDVSLTHLLADLATGTHILAVSGPKGGAGKSTTALLAGMVLAEVPLARPILLEVNPDWGTLDELLGRANPRTIADLLRDYVAIDRAGIGLLQGYVTMFGRLPVLTAPGDPDAMAQLSPRDYDRVLRLLALHYNVILLDCGTAFTQRLNQFALQRADHLVVVGWPEQAAMSKTLAAVEYLASARYERDYRGVLAEVAATGGIGDVRARALADMTLAINGIGHTGGTDPIDHRRVRAAASGLHALIELPYVPALRALLADGALTIEALPVASRRAVKRLLVAVLSRLAEV